MERNLIEPIWELYHIDNIDEFSIDDIRFDHESSEYFKDQYSLEKRKAIYESLEWAENNPNYNFKNIMKDAPVPNEITFSNSEVHVYLMKLKGFFENGDYSLLEDDRPPKEV